MKNENAIRIETVRTDAFSMDFFRFGRGKETLVILPGLSIQSVMGAADSIAGAYRLLADDFLIYVFDRRKDLPPTYSVDDMAKDTAEAIRALKLECVNIFGASQGGMIAMKIAVTSPELVSRLVLGSTSARLTEEKYQTVEKWIGLAKEQDAAALYPAFGEAIYPPALYERAKSLLLDAAKAVTKTDLDRFVILAQGMKDFDILQDLKKNSCPVLIIGDREDRLLVRNRQKRSHVL